MMKLVFSMMFVGSSVFAAAASTPVAVSVSGKCEKEIYAQVEKHILKGADGDFDFQGISEISANGNNEFSVGYGFNDECIGSVTTKITPIKVIKKANAKSGYLEATECKIEKLTDEQAECG